jgi:hypothetical protein
LSDSPLERGIKRLQRRSAPDHNKVGVQGDTPSNTAATPDNSAAHTPAGTTFAAPALIVVPGSSHWTELATSLVAVAIWAVLAWRGRPGGPPVS